MGYRYELDDNDDEEVVDYAKWTRNVRLADWRVFVVLMMLVALFAVSMFSGNNGASLFSALFGKIMSLSFVGALAFYVIWGISLYKVISQRGFRCVTISGICFMVYPVVTILVLRIVMTIGLWLDTKLKLTIKKAWQRASASLTLGRSLTLIFLGGMILLFMGICFSAQQEVAEKRKRIERL